MVVIALEEFLMGSPVSEPGRFPDEVQHRRRSRALCDRRGTGHQRAVRPLSQAPSVNRDPHLAI